MTLQEIQESIQVLYEGDTDTPTSGSEDWNLRTELINAAINRWEKEGGVLWNELWVKLSDAADGDKTTAADTTSYDCPSDFKAIGGYVRLTGTDGTTYYKVIPTQDVQLYDNSTTALCYVTGNASNGFDINFISAPAAGLTINYEYYKEADTVSQTTDVLEMSDPYFAIYFTTSQLFSNDGRINEKRDEFVKAEARLRQMVVRNGQNPWWQDNTIKDTDFDQGVGGFGV